jgi:hypothetical protein
VSYAREKNPEEKYGKNPNASPFKSMAWVYLVYAWGTITITAVVIKIASG